MQRWSQYFPMLQRMIVDCSIPHTIHTDNTPEFKLEKWNNFTKMYLIKNTYTEAYHPYQNPCERHGGVLKAATSHLLLVMGAPLNFWCYALDYIALLQLVIVHQNLNWDTPHTLHYGDTLDISIFHFVFGPLCGTMQPVTPFLILRCSLASSLDLPVMLEMQFAFSLLLTMMILSLIKSLHNQLSDVVIHRNRLQQWIEYNILKFYTNDGKTTLDDTVDDSGFSLKDYIHPEKSSATLLWIWSNLLLIRMILFMMLLLKSMALQQNVSILSSPVLWSWQLGMCTLFSHLPHHYHLNHFPPVLTERIPTTKILVSPQP